MKQSPMTALPPGSVTRRATITRHSTDAIVMTNDDEIQHRSFYQPDAGRVELREDSDDGVFSVRMPIATTGEVRNEGDDPLTRDELAGMGSQVDEQAIGVFLDHGKNPDVAGSRYSATEKVGEWRDADLSERDGGETELVATATMMDPDTLSGNTGDLREALAALKAQVERGFSLSSSIGWKGDEDAPGGNDLMEASIVGIPADPRTTSQDAAVAHARDVLADADLPDEDKERLVEDFRAVVMGSESEQDMTDEDDSADAETDSEQSGAEEADETQEAPEWVNSMTDLLESIHEAVREDDEDEEEDDDEDEDEEDDEKQSSESPESEQSSEVGELRSEVEELREQVNNADPANPADQGDDADPDETQDADDEDTEERESEAQSGPDWRA